MTSTIDPKAIGKPVRPRRHVRTLTGKCAYLRVSAMLIFLILFCAPGYLPEKDASGKEKWPRGDEKVWKAGMRVVDKGM